jgi:hypothetical protein
MSVAYYGFSEERGYVVAGTIYEVFILLLLLSVLEELSDLRAHHFFRSWKVKLRVSRSVLYDSNSAD